jgi:phenylalanyl-tRNA synthetase beta chain
MLVSFDWLKEYVAVDLTAKQLAERLMFAGLNDDGQTAVGDDVQLNLEVTSNRPDWLGIIGIAREAAVLLGKPLTLPDPQLASGKTPVGKLAAVELNCPELCPRYTARVIRGVKIKPSPAWMVKRLATLGLPSINNVVDITNYVLMECGQPLHAFDLDKLAGHKIIVRRAMADENFLAINHKAYKLDSSMCVIADAERPVALGGVMGGADTEVGDRTTNLLIESASFDPRSIRATARALNLHSDSSYRFERLLDPAGVDWASRRACQLILELAGGELAEGLLDAGTPAPQREPITLRFDQLKRILGINVPADEARRILLALGNVEVRADKQKIEVIPPSWRQDLHREIDLVEEVARVHGYDKIPEDTQVPMVPSHRTISDRILEKIRTVLVAAGFDEALTLSVVEDHAFSPWSDVPPLATNMPVLRGADRLRRTLVPSLLAARRTNESLGNRTIELFELAKIYLPQAAPGALPHEPLMLALTSGGDYRATKGVIEALVDTLNPLAQLIAGPIKLLPLSDDRAAELCVQISGSEPIKLGYLGELSAAGLKEFDLRAATTVAELQISALIQIAQLVPQYRPLPVYPAIERDLNFVVDEPVTWEKLSATVRQAAGEIVEQVSFVDAYRDEARLGAGKKSLVLSVVLRSPTGTLTSDQADTACNQAIAAVAKELGGQLR